MTPSQVAADMKPPKESIAVQWSVRLRETAPNFELNGK